MDIVFSYDITVVVVTYIYARYIYLPINKSRAPKKRLYFLSAFLSRNHVDSLHKKNELHTGLTKLSNINNVEKGIELLNIYLVKVAIRSRYLLCYKCNDGTFRRGIYCVERLSGVVELLLYVHQVGACKAFDVY